MSKVLIKKNAGIILVLAFSVVFSAACSKNSNTGNSTISTNSTNSSNTTSNTSSSSTGGATAAAGSPTAALKAYYEAANKRDFEAAKRYLSAGTMRVMEEGAKKMGKTVDEAFKDSPEQTITPEFLNEKISGDTATVDLKAQDMTITMPMVKENGEWKLAMDKMMEDLQKSMGGGEVKGGPKDDDDNDNK